MKTAAFVGSTYQRHIIPRGISTAKCTYLTKIRFEVVGDCRIVLGGLGSISKYLMHIFHKATQTDRTWVRQNKPKCSAAPSSAAIRDLIVEED